MVKTLLAFVVAASLSLSAFAQSQFVAGQVMWGICSGYDSNYCKNETDPCFSGASAYKNFNAANMHLVRLSVSWEEINPQPGVWNWKAMDAQVDAINASGGIPYFNVQNIPPWASEGKPAYYGWSTYTDKGCMWWNNAANVHIVVDGGENVPDTKVPHPGSAMDDYYHVAPGGTLTIASPGVFLNDTKDFTGIGTLSLCSVSVASNKGYTEHGKIHLNCDGSFTYVNNGDGATTDTFDYNVWGFSGGPFNLRFTDERDFCSNPPHVNAQAVYDMAKSIALHFGSRVTYYGFGNEPGYIWNWPPSSDKYDNGRDWDRYYSEVVKPFSDGVHSVAGKLVVGPEDDYYYGLKVLLTLEKQNHDHIYDVISFHGYAWSNNYPADALRRLDEEFLPVANEFKGNRPLWITETGAPGIDPTKSDSDAVKFEQETLDFAKGMQQRGVNAVTFFPFYWWVNDDGTPRQILTSFSKMFPPAPRLKMRAVRPPFIRVP